MKKAKLFVLVSVFVLVSIVGFWLAQKLTQPSNGQRNQQGVAIIQNPQKHGENKPDFWELTIPYLRERSYESKLGNLEPVSQNQNYEVFLTSYQSDSLKINGLLTRPTGQMPDGGWPAIVFIHGYIPPAQYSTRLRYEDYVNYLARNGFVVFKIDLRGHGESEGFASGAYYSSDYIVDTLNARAALANAPFVNGNKIGLWGHSMAGNVVFRSLAAAPEIPAVVVWAGAVYTYEDFQSLGINDNSYQPPDPNSSRRQRRRELFEAHGEFSMDSPFWSQVTPINYIEDIKGAIAIHHATNDEVVNVGYGRNLNELLNQYNISHEFFEYPSGGHNLTGSSFNQAMQRTVNFYKLYLQ